MSRFLHASRILALLLFAVPAMEIHPAHAAEQPADLVLRNGVILTVDKNLGTVEAIAVRGNRILSVGNNNKINQFVGKNTTVIDLDGAFAMPGFIEGHAHFISLGESMMNLDLTGAQNWKEIIDLIAQQVRTSSRENGLSGAVGIKRNGINGRKIRWKVFLRITT